MSSKRDRREQCSARMLTLCDNPDDGTPWSGNELRAAIAAASIVAATARDRYTRRAALVDVDALVELSQLTHAVDDAVSPTRNDGPSR